MIDFDLFGTNKKKMTEQIIKNLEIYRRTSIQKDPTTYPWPADNQRVKELERRNRELEAELEGLRQKLESVKGRKDMFKELWQEAARDREMMQGHLFQERKNNQRRILNLIDEIDALKASYAKREVQDSP